MPAEVCVVVYDLIKPLNAGLRVLGTGAFHVGVKVHGNEWGYGFAYLGTGIFSCEPQVSMGMKYRQALFQGETTLNGDQVQQVLRKLRSKWIGKDYDLLSHSCCSFADLFCQIIGANPLPSWVANLAAAGATVGGGCLKVMSEEEREIVLSKAKLGEIDQKYTVESGATAKTLRLLQQRHGSREALPSFWAELGPASAPVGATKAVPDPPKHVPLSPRKGLSDRGHSQAAPTLLSQYAPRHPVPATEEVTVSNELSSQRDCGCCQQ